VFLQISGKHEYSIGFKAFSNRIFRQILLYLRLGGFKCLIHLAPVVNGYCDGGLIGNQTKFGRVGFRLSILNSVDGNFYLK